ncbi:MAG: xanthine dehydrogenase family protein molybdopterin-binding subunit [bacterium]
MQAIGQSVVRREGEEKLLGTALYVDDLPREGVWFGATVRTTEPHGRLVRLEKDPAFPWRDVVVATAADVPGRNVVPLIVEDQPALVSNVFLHAEEPVALVAAPDRELAESAVQAIRVVTESLPPVLDIDEALALGAGHLFKRIDIAKGDPDAALASADVVVEGEYVFGSQEHVYIEPQGMQAEWSAGGVLLRGSLQCPYYVVKGVAPVLGLDPHDVRVIQTVTGGGFGGKEEYPTLLGAHAAILARKAGRPVRIVYDRVEDMRATTKRHPGRVRHRTALAKDGRIVAMDIDVLLDGGAYCTLTPVVLSRGAIHAAGPYDVPNVRVLARAVRTNHPPFGAFRGFGAPQTLFAVEAHLDECAHRLGLSPVELRRKNLIRKGGTLATGQSVGEDVAAEDVLEGALAESRYEERRAECERFNRDAETRPGAARFRRRGLGLSLFHHGAGFTGSGEVTLASEAGLEARADGTVLVLSAQTEIGQGTRTILAQAAADGLGVPVDRIRTADPDTAVVPNSGPTVASRTGMVVGGLLVRAGREMRRLAEEKAGRALPGTEQLLAQLRTLAAARPLRILARYEPPPDVVWDESTYRGDAYATYAWACDVVALEVDVLTGETTVLDVTAVQEVGRVINPVLAAGQVEGGVAQGIGWALLESVAWEAGRMTNPTMTDYVVPTAKDTPPVRVVFLERPHARAPHGAKGVGELPMDGPAPAVVNALRHALGVRLAQVPATPERILEALDAPSARP